MKVNLPVIDKLLDPIWSRFKRDNFTHKSTDLNPPFRAELFSKEQMVGHAQYLATHHMLSNEYSPEVLLRELSENEDILFEINELLKKSVSEKKPISHAGEWLLDNYYITEEQIRIAKRYLPKGYSKGLPRLIGGIPRVYVIATEIISHSDGRIDVASLHDFITEYQKGRELTLGELWAVPIMLRLALLENLGRVAIRIAVGRKDSALANDWAKRIIATVEKNPEDLVLIIADMARSNPPMVSAFVAEFARKLQWMGPELSLPLSWVEQHLSASNQTTSSMVLEENQKQAADQVSVSNSFGSLRLLAKMDWRNFVESVSLVEQILRTDIAGRYSAMDFYTRDTYRHKIEAIAKTSRMTERGVAEVAIALAEKNARIDSGNKRTAHVGYYLISKGVEETERIAGVYRTPAQWMRRMMDRGGVNIYFGIAFLVTLVVSSTIFLTLAEDNVSKEWAVVIVTLGLIASSQLSISLANWFASLWIKPKPLPKLDFSMGIPVEYRTMVVIPSMLVNTRQIEKIAEDLEVRYLANQESNLLFALLTDFQDADVEAQPEDEGLLATVTRRIEQLNVRYGRLSNDTFYLFHRPRSWNAQDSRWMGYERKRGKLSDLNQTLLGKNNGAFSSIVGDAKIYTTVKYVITLDTDTQLPRDMGWKLVGLMAHPLNLAVFDAKKRRTVDGYGIIQPRISISLHGAIRSGYSRLHENDAGIDPYTRVTSDIYQDVFGEGSFIGKGIYDVDAFEKALRGRFPENRILSHDLLEGGYARCGFASDVQLYEDFPSHYFQDIGRRYRWIRGDWQIAFWCLPFVPGIKTRFRKNALSALSRWKIFDNLRRSLVPVANTLLLVAGWTVLSSPWFWTSVVLMMMCMPSVVSSIWSALHKPDEVAVSQHLSTTSQLASRSALQVAFRITCLPYEAYISLLAMAITSWRLIVSRRNLLEWNTTGFSSFLAGGLKASYKVMWVSPALAIGVFLSVILLNPSALFLASPFLILWIFAPAVIELLGKPLESAKSVLRSEQKLYLRELARKTWSFFEALINKENHWLPPDNIQEYPTPIIAHRTSPTNIGLSLLASLSAFDFGYITAGSLLRRTASTFESLQKLERYKGHFFNWYDTLSLLPLSPRYISTVDSGNLVGHLLTLRQGLLGITLQRIVEQKDLLGLQDTLRIAMNEVATKDRILFDSLKRLYELINIQDFDLKELHFQVNELSQQLLAVVSDSANQPAHNWLVSFAQQVDSLRLELQVMTPWLIQGGVPSKFTDWKVTGAIPTLKELASMDSNLSDEFKNRMASVNTEEEEHWLTQFQQYVQEASSAARDRILTIQNLATECRGLSELDYGFLYNKAQHLLCIGYNVDEQERDAGFYDLMASEARLGLFVAIAQGKLPQESWFVLGRRLTTVGSRPVLISWSGSMFEYLMPSLVMPTYEHTLLDITCIGAVKKQIEYGEARNVPWGISESCYNLVDAHLTYQYKAFGVPGLGFKRGLGQELVIAPYATILALMVDPQAAYTNLQNMKAMGFEGSYGFFEAIDYSPVRMMRGQTHSVLRVFMAHHQGMSLLSLAYLLLDQPMQKRFEADTQFQSALLLLQERVPRTTGYYAGSSDSGRLSALPTTNEIRSIQTSDTPVPEVQFLSNGRLFIMLSNAGGGYCRWKDIAVTRWREDSTCDHWGMYCYVQDRTQQSFWSVAHQPTGKKADQYEAIFSQGRVEFRRRDDGVETHTVVIVSPEDDVEVRRIHLTNRSKSTKRLEVTSYGEVVLASHASDDSHPAFSNLFVQTEIREHQHAIFCTRRPRSKEERPPWMFHMMKVSGSHPNEVSYETDRSKFIGRGRTVRHPQVMDQTDPLSGTQGSVLDPIVSIQQKFALHPGDSITVDIVTGVAEAQEPLLGLVDKYQEKHFRDRAFELSWTHSQVVLRQIGALEADAQLYGKLASSILYLNPALRASSSVLSRNRRGQSALWSHSISGDLPIVLLFVSKSENVLLVRQLIKAQAYWHMNGLSVDLVILNEDLSGYRQALQDQILGVIATGMGMATSEKRGHIFTRPIDQISDEDRILLQAVARVIISDAKGSLEEQLSQVSSVKGPVPKLMPVKLHAPQQLPFTAPSGLQFFNGTGGFSADGREYVIITQRGNRTPLPWINVLANPRFGTILSESGSSYTWFENAHAFRLTPWHNDAISDSSGEVFYLRDEETGHFWSPLGLPANSNTPLVTRHGFGYSKIEHQVNGIQTVMGIHVDVESPIKCIVMKVTNQSGRRRKLTATGFVEWVLGELRPASALHVVTEAHPSSGALMVRNSFGPDFKDHVAFFMTDEKDFGFTTDRTEFIGRNGDLQHPEAMNRSHLSGKYNAGLDPCAAIQVVIDLEEGESRTVIFKLGAGKNLQEATAVMERFHGEAAVNASLARVMEFWRETLDAVQVQTPDPSINILANGWLLYQVIGSRMWGRSGFYQSGGAFGFRDQLQDVMALMHTTPLLAREQIMRCASRQFKEGDVQHWWHPPVGRGVRTLCSDDLLWLPYVVSRYVVITEDVGILDERVSFLQGRYLEVDEESYYDMPIISDREGTLYEHCKEAIIRSLPLGEHGLPLIGSGDWNDGMNRVGIRGKGESVWLAFFLYDVLVRFNTIAARQGDQEFIAKMELHAAGLRASIDLHGWDGEWYLRAYFDDGTPLGSKTMTECKIDSLSQSWSVLSGAGDSMRSLNSMEAVNKFLIDRTNQLIRVLDPPFDKMNVDPGYIKGYLPGIRENGGQYTHAAIWTVMAFAKLGDSEKTEELMRMINPIHHASTAQGLQRYKVEPYVVSADVYGVEPHAGRGGWTWYTGSAGWMYQLILESILGLKRTGTTITVRPCIPNSWKSFSVRYHHKKFVYQIEVIQSGGRYDVFTDGIKQNGRVIQFRSDPLQSTLGEE